MVTTVDDSQVPVNIDGVIVENEVIHPPAVHGELEIDEAVLESLPIPGTKVKTAYQYGSSLWGKTAKLVTDLPDGTARNYFLKILPNNDPGQQMCEGEYESLKAIYAVMPTFVPQVYKWGYLKKGPGCFLLSEFREVGQQPPDPRKFTMRVAELHQKSTSPDGKFGFHVPTFHGNLATYTGWEESWTVMYSKILARAMDLDHEEHGDWPEFNAIRKLFFDKVIPRLLDPLQSHGRSIKPCLVHGDLWDENTATDMTNGEPFAFDSGAFYAHNEYEIGYWRPPRHRLSNRTYIRFYKRFFPVSEPEDEWDARNMLYSMRYNIGYSVLVPSSGQRQVVFEDMKTLCRKYYPHMLREVEESFGGYVAESVADTDELEIEEDEVSRAESQLANIGFWDVREYAESEDGMKLEDPKIEPAEWTNSEVGLTKASESEDWQEKSGSHQTEPPQSKSFSEPWQADSVDVPRYLSEAILPGGGSATNDETGLAVIGDLPEQKRLSTADKHPELEDPKTTKIPPQERDPRGSVPTASYPHEVGELARDETSTEAHLLEGKAVSMDQLPEGTQVSS